MKTTSREECTAKKSWQGGRFLELYFAGSGARKPRRELEGCALEISFLAFQGSQVSLCSCSTIKFLKASKIYSILEGKIQIIPWQGVFFFTNTVSQKS